MDFKDKIKEQISIVDVASLYVSLKPAGKNFKALCPFHSEKTPSFFVMPDKNTFSCFGCHRFGDIFTMVQEMENITFVEAMHFVADKFNIPFEKGRSQGVKKDEYLQLNETALEYFRQSLNSPGEGRAALDYLLRRGLTRETIELFAIGYAPDSWDGLAGRLRQKRAPLEKAVELGLLVRNEKGRIYDRFRGRVIFPIFSETGAILAFGGRIVVAAGDSAPGAAPVGAKYLNSPDSPVYRKGNHLFGFHLSKNPMKEEKAGLLVEGYLDMISLYQAGFRHVAASLGTALTEKQIHLLKRFCGQIHLFYDRDAAGEAATIRNIEKLFEQNVNPGIVLIEGAKDPDEFVRARGAEALRGALQHPEDGFNFLLGKAAREFDFRDPAGKRRGLDMALAVVSRIGDPVIREEYVQRLASFFQVRAELLRTEAAPSAAAAAGSAEPLAISLMEEKILEAVLRVPDVVPEIREFFDDELLAALAGRNIIRQLFASHARCGEFRFAEINQRLTPAEQARLHEVFARKTLACKERAEIEKDIITGIKNFQLKLVRNRTRLLNQEIAAAERERDGEKLKRLMRQKADLVVRPSRTDRSPEGPIAKEN
ncbi:MAG TPA: DNA primase [Candidatus Aminicenantes bacterium]|nr:DNA primase [Candidatus Aminicenantes bacterium]